MADKKISQLTTASTPLAGTEVLPIVQSGSTVKVSAADVTAGRQVSAAGLTVTNSTVPANGMYLPTTNTIGFSTNSIARARLNASGEFAIGNIATPRAELDVAHSDTSGSVTKSIHLGYSGANFYGYRVSNTNNAGATYAGTFAIQRGEGTQWTDNFTISDVGNVSVNTGNLVVGTAAKGIDFSANTGAAGETGALLNWYEEGTWTPVYSPAAGAFGAITYNAATYGRYTRVGRLVTVQGTIITEGITVGTATGNARIGGLPFSSATDAALTVGYSAGFNTNNPIGGYTSGSVIFLTYKATANGGSSIITVPGLDTGASFKNYVVFQTSYIV